MYTYVGEIESTARFGGFLMGLIFFVFAIYLVFAILAVAVIVLRLVANYKLFQRAGLEGWRQFIPVYGSWCRAKIAFGTGYEYIGLIPWIQILLCCIPYIGWIASIVGMAQSMYIQYKYAASFGASPVLQVVTSLTEVIGEQVLAFGKQYRYIGCQREVLGLPRMNNQNSYQYNAYNNGQYQNPGQYQGNGPIYQNPGQYQGNEPIYQNPQGEAYGFDYNTNPNNASQSSVNVEQNQNPVDTNANPVDTNVNPAVNLKKEDETSDDNK